MNEAEMEKRIDALRDRMAKATPFENDSRVAKLEYDVAVLQLGMVRAMRCIERLTSVLEGKKP